MPSVNFFKKTNIRYKQNLKICGDQEFTMQYLKKYKAKYIDEIVSYYLLGGISSVSTCKILKEKFLINSQYKLSYFPILKSFIKTQIIKIRDKILDI